MQKITTDCIESLIVVFDSELKRLEYDKSNLSKLSFIPKEEAKKLFENKINIIKRFKDLFESSKSIKEDIKKFSVGEFESGIDSIDFFLKQMKMLSETSGGKYSSDETVKLIQKCKRQVISLYKK